MSLAAVGVAFEVDILMLERAPQSLDEHIVHPTAPAVHRDANAGCRQHAGEGCAGELATLVGVEDLRGAEADERLLERVAAERDVHGVRQPPRQSIARPRSR